MREQRQAIVVSLGSGIGEGFLEFLDDDACLEVHQKACHLMNAALHVLFDERLARSELHGPRGWQRQWVVENMMTIRRAG